MLRYEIPADIIHEVIRLFEISLQMCIAETNKRGAFRDLIEDLKKARTANLKEEAKAVGEQVDFLSNS